MGENNVLSGGVDVLTQMRESLVALDDMRKQSKELEATENKANQDIDLKQKMITDEIALTVKKRQEEVEESFDGQIDQTRARLKKVKAKRDKEKNAAVSERIGRETADIVEEKRKLKQDLNEIFKVNQIPRIFNNGAFFTFFLPGEALDYLKIALCVIVFGAIPVIVNLFLPEGSNKALIMVLMYVGIVVVFGGLYFLIFKNVRNKHIGKLREARMVRNKIRRTQKLEEEKGKLIKKDKDESGYNLSDFDAEISQLDNQIVEISEAKKQALTSFENETKLNIANDIRSRHEQELADLKSTYDNAYAQRKQLDDQIGATVLDISSRYEGYIGKENLQLSTIDSLIEIINTGDALNIADALVVYKRRMAEAGTGK
ncbi:MAG: hypothetical protein ILP10_01635 [Lachnospiraceae bacterium]|nr:hypothetical protein [Lachnospiraceae bacterium]